MLIFSSSHSSFVKASPFLFPFPPFSQQCGVAGRPSPEASFLEEGELTEHGSDPHAGSPLIRTGAPLHYLPHDVHTPAGEIRIKRRAPGSLPGRSGPVCGQRIPGSGSHALLDPVDETSPDLPYLSGSAYPSVAHACAHASNWLSA